jgi:acylpyruvate hydrolase
MKLATFIPPNERTARIGALIESENYDLIMDLGGLASDMTGFIEGGRALLDRAKTLLRNAAGGEAHRMDAVSFLPPVPRPGKIISLGVNYRSHGDEAAHLDSVKHLMSGPRIPRAFSKLSSTLAGHRAAVAYPAATRQLDYEIELAFVIARRSKNVPAARWADHVYGYTIYNDLSMRDVQSGEMQAGLLLLGKNFDGAAPMGPWLVTADEIPDPHALDLRLSVNGEVRQSDNTRNMISPIPEILEYWSQMTLEPGDIISTGTPSGAAIFRDPPESYLLRPGDRLAATITGLGTLENTIVGPAHH